MGEFSVYHLSFQLWITASGQLKESAPVESLILDDMDGATSSIGYFALDRHSFNLNAAYLKMELISSARIGIVIPKHSNKFLTEC